MRFLTLFILGLISNIASAQMSVETIFDFSQPLKLTPSVIPGPDDMDRVAITDSIFNSDGVIVSFKDKGGLTGAQIRTSIGSKATTYNLTITDLTEFTITLNEGISLQSVYLGENAVNGGLNLSADQPGSYSPGSRKWTNTTNGTVKSISFMTSGGNTEIHQLHVTYTTTENTLTPQPNISDGSIIPEFSGLQLTFADDMEIADASNITINKEGVEEVATTLSATVDKKVVTLSPTSVIAEDGVYTIKVPAHCFKNAKGFYNKELTYTFTVDIPKNTMVYQSVTPETGRVTEVPTVFTLKYKEPVGHADGEATLLKDGELKAPVKITKKEDNTVQLELENLQNGFTAEGVYTITIPEKTIYNVWYNSENHKSELRWNPEFTLKYEISNAPIKSETLIAAEELLKVEGLGYPKASSAARVALKNLVEAGTASSDEDLEAAMSAFYAETDVTLPETGKYYTVSSVNSKGAKLYLSETTTGITLDDNAKKAVSLEATLNENGTLTFKTSDGKCLQMLVGKDIYEAKASNTTDAYSSALNDLSFSKLNVQNVDIKSQFGLFSINGGLGKNDLNVEKSANALVKYSNKTIVTDVDIPLYFTEDLSSAFCIEEVLAPVAIEATLSKQTVTSNAEKIVLTWAEDKNIELVDAEAPYFADSEGQKIATAPMTLVEGSKTEYEISLEGLAEGEYTLVIPNGAFACTVDGKTRNVKAVTASFKIFNKQGSGDDAGLNAAYEPIYVYNAIMPDVPIKDIWLNDFTVYVYKNQFSGLYVNPAKTVKLFDIRKNLVVTEGQLVPTTLPDMDDVLALKVDFQPAITEGQLRKDSYKIIIERGTIGDLNFEKYLNDKSSVDASDCMVNPELTYTRYVNNATATSIGGINADGVEGEQVIYDLSGRRLKAISAPGVYIVNGRKVVVRK